MMIVIFLLSWVRERFVISISSMRIYPVVLCKILSKERVNVDFPAPVLPTTPTFSEGLNTTEKFYNENGKFSLYFTENL